MNELPHGGPTGLWNDRIADLLKRGLLHPSIDESLYTFVCPVAANAEEGRMVRCGAPRPTRPTLTWPARARSAFGPGRPPLHFD